MANSRLIRKEKWDAATGDKLDKDRFRRDLGRVEEAYGEVLRRVRRIPAPTNS